MSFRPSLRLVRGLDGLPLVSAQEERASKIVVALCTTWMLLVAAWEMFGPLLAGHFASSASMGIIAENMLRWRIVGPVWEYTATLPSPDLYYCHHPWGIFWVTAFFMKVFGRHDVVCRLPAILLSIATPPLLYALGRSIWRPASGAAAALGFVVLPITLSFAAFNALEVPLMVWTLLALYGWVRLVQTWRRRYLVVSVLGLFMALHADWPAYVVAAEILAFSLLRVYLGGRAFFGTIHERRYAEFWILWATLSVLTGVFYLATFQKVGKLGELLSVYGSRSSGNAVPLSAVLASRRYWIELSFTPIAIALGKIAAVVCLVRVVVLRAEIEVVPLVVLGMATFQYVVFKQGADIHVFWPQPFGAYFALAMGALVATLASVFSLAALRLSRLRALARVFTEERAGLIALALLALPLLAVLRDAVPAVAYARATGGRFNEKGLFIESDGEKTAALIDLEKHLPKAAAVEMHESMHATWAQVWTLGGRVVRTNRPLPTGPLPGVFDVFLLDSRFTSEPELSAASKKFHIVVVGSVWIIHPREPFAPMDVSSLTSREPGAIEWALFSASEPVRTIVPDAWATWESRVHFDQPASPPDEPPRTFEQKRIAHNAAIARGDTAQAEALLADVLGALRPLDATYEGGLSILGVMTTTTSVSPSLTFVFRAPGPLPSGSGLAVRSKVVARAKLSLTMADPTTRELAPPLSLPPARLRPGFLYSLVVPIVKRPGTEVFQVSALGRNRAGLRRDKPGAASILDVLTLN